MILHSTIDYETKSAAGYYWDDVAKKWHGPKGAPQGRKGLGVIGAAVYAEHPSTDVLTLSFTISGGISGRWRPGLPLSLLQPLFDWIAAGGHVEAHNVMFERLIWNRICIPRYGFPPLPPEQLSCSMATARVNSLPGKLENLGDVLQLAVRKNKDGRRLLEKFSVPRKPTKGDPRVWITPEEDPLEAERLYIYCDDDVATEIAASARMKPMTPAEREFWLIDQEINWRGLAIDRKGVRDCIAVLEQCLAHYGAEMRALTGGLEPTQLQKLMGWLAANGVYTSSLDEEHLDALLASPTIAPHPPGGVNPARRVLELRALSGSASVKKLFAMENMASSDDRLHDLIVHHGARTGRPTDNGAQPLNMPRTGSKLVTCGACSKPFKPGHTACVWCNMPTSPGRKAQWTPAMIEHVLEIMAHRSLELLEWYFGDAQTTISGCLRGLFTAGPGMDLIASDYSAIEAVVTAMLAGEQWRIDAFNAGTDIYLASGEKMDGIPLETFLQYKRDHGEHHPDRQTKYKVAELALGFGGWIGAWRNFDKGPNFTDPQVKGMIKAWREASPMIVELWGGQWRGPPWDGYAQRFGLEGAALDALQFPDEVHPVRLFDHAANAWRTVPGLSLFMRDGALIIRLPSTRELTYHEPVISDSDREWKSPGELTITYSTWNTDPKKGAIGWIRMSTYGARLTENVVQAVAHDLLRNAIILLRAHGYHTVLHVYDEIVVEVVIGHGSVEEVERLMATVPGWATGWPVRAADGWRGFRYRKG
jgi:DNA polymerase